MVSAGSNAVRIEILIRTIPRTLTVAYFAGPLRRNGSPAAKAIWEHDCDLGMLLAQQASCKLQTVEGGYVLPLTSIGKGRAYLTVNVSWAIRPAGDSADLMIAWGAWMFLLENVGSTPDQYTQ